MYGMKKTTLYLPEELKASLERMAADELRSEAEIIREAIAEKVDRRTRPRPNLPLCAAGLASDLLQAPQIAVELTAHDQRWENLNRSFAAAPRPKTRLPQRPLRISSSLRGARGPELLHSCRGGSGYSERSTAP